MCIIEIKEDQLNGNEQRLFIQSWLQQGDQPSSLVFGQRLNGRDGGGGKHGVGAECRLWAWGSCRWAYLK